MEKNQIARRGSAAGVITLNGGPGVAGRRRFRPLEAVGHHLDQGPQHLLAPPTLPVLVRVVLLLVLLSCWCCWWCWWCWCCCR